MTTKKKVEKSIELEICDAKEKFTDSPCRKCKTPLKYKASKLKKKYYYTGYYRCPKCKTIYYSDKFKIINNPNKND